MNNIDGFFSVVEEVDGIYLTVFPPLGGNPVTVEKVVEYLNNMGYTGYDIQSISKCVEAADAQKHLIISKGQPEEIAASPQPVEKRYAENIEIEIFNDGMEAYITIIEPLDVTREELLSILRENGIVYGILQKNLDYVVRQKTAEHILIAQGLPPKHGIDAKFEKKYVVKEKLTPKVLEDGRVDYRELDLITCVNKGDVLLEKIPPVEGRDGRKVTGEIIKHRPARDLPFPRGRNTVISKDGRYLLADMDGAVIETKDGKINVEFLYVIDGDVDFATGNIYHVGSLLIKGDVREGFKVVCNGDVEVLGAVEGAFITSKEGSINIHKGVKGQSKGLLRAAQNVMALFFENVKIVAEGDVRAREGIINCDIMSGGRILVEGKKAIIAGGVASAEKFILCDSVGSPSGPKTVLKIEAFNAVQLYAEVIAIDEQFQKIMKQLLDLKRIITPVLRYGERVISQLPSGQREAINLNLKKYLSYRKHLQLLAQRKNELIRLLLPRGGEAIYVKNKVYPRTVIYIRGHKKEIKDEFEHTTFKFDSTKGEIVISPFSYNEDKAGR